MKNVTTWASPVAVSLLLHLTLLIVLTYNYSSNNLQANSTQTFTVELQASQPATSNKPHINKPKQITPSVAKPVKQENIIEKTLPTPVVQTEESKQTETTTVNQQPNYIGENNDQIKLQPLSKLTRLPSFLSKIEPVYPSAEQHAGTQATVLAEIMLDKEGKVLDIKIVKSAGLYFDNAVIDAIRKSRFNPGLIEQEPVAVKVLLPFRFKLK